MKYIITSDCICCGECVDYCNYAAIEFNKHHFLIDLYKCMECNHCYLDCPVHAIEENWFNI